MIKHSSLAEERGGNPAGFGEYPVSWLEGMLYWRLMLWSKPALKRARAVLRLAEDKAEIFGNYRIFSYYLFQIFVNQNNKMVN